VTFWVTGDPDTEIPVAAGTAKVTPLFTTYTSYVPVATPDIE
jgi:hypothetical protein